jgi:hypothetical protein
MAVGARERCVVTAGARSGGKAGAASSATAGSPSERGSSSPAAELPPPLVSRTAMATAGERSPLLAADGLVPVAAASLTCKM